MNRPKSPLSEIVKEIPVLLFFIYLAYLCTVFHNRDHMMLDYPLTYDHWWYFYHRLAEGSIAQWNPYSLLGRIAVQWNYVPVSMFSPLIALSGLTLDSFHNYHILSTFMSISALYITGRLLKYDRFYCLLPVVLIVTSGYRYWSAFLHFSTFLFCYPLAVAFLVSSIDSKGRDLYLKWLMFTLLLSLSFTGLRLEKIVYETGFIALTFFILGLYQYGSWRKMAGWFAAGTATIAIALASNAWHISLLVNSTLGNHRLVGGLNLEKLFDVTLLKWVLFSIIYQPALLLVCANLLLLACTGLTPRLRSRNISFIPALFFIGAELALMKLIPKLFSASEAAGFISNVFGKWNIHKNTDIVFSWHGMLAIVSAAIFYILVEKKVTLKKLLQFLSVLFAGFYIAEYSWQVWPLNHNRHSFFMIPLFASFISLGAVSLMLKKKTWILSVLVIYHFIGETISFYLFEIAGMPWNVPRAALMEVPFQAILILEAVTFIVRGTSLFVFKFKKELLVKSNKINFSYLKEKITLSQIVCILFAFLVIKPFLMPVNAQGDRYVEDFPFSESLINTSKTINADITEAYDNAVIIKQKDSREHNPFKRMRIEDSVLSFGPEMFYKYMPAFSQTLNTAPVYSSEIPSMMKRIFSDTPGKKGLDLLRYHPEMNPLFFAYKEFTWDSNNGDISKLYDYLNQVTILPHKEDNIVFKEIMAEEGSHTPRAFLTTTVLQFDHYTDEYNYLYDILTKGGLLTNQITTSDKLFPDQPPEYCSGADLDYSLDFLKDDPENIMIKADSNKDAYLSLMDLWDRGWKATVDGHPTTIYRGYMGTRFIRIDRGRHLIEFKYSVPGFIASSTVSIITWIFILLAAVIIKIRKQDV